MSPAPWQRIRELFLQIRDEEHGARARVLDEECGEDAALRAEVESLLRYHDRAADFLEKPALIRADEAVAPKHSSVLAGHRIGKYTITREIAAGGMGIVYEARQEHPDRIVALKTAKSRFVSSSARHRFEHESEILAHLNHPAIAQIYEAGTEGEGDGGIPYFAMEFIPGAKSITEYATDHRLPRNQRLALFADVCDAIHFGHQKGVIHRDLKPANILVTGDGRPKVIDFGVARFVDPHATLANTATLPGQLLGTLQYMSPEQLGGDPSALDVRTDVYALGVVLFELLTGELPYDATKPGIYEAARVIRERPPLRPSTCDRALRGDLEVIILKCLEKAPGRRYQSVAELVSDLCRHLRHEPIEARRDSAAYVLRRNLYRHRRPLALTVVVISAIVAAGWAFSSDRQAEDARMRAALSLGRTWTRDNAPVAASETLWREFLNLDCNRTRFALWEFYLTYPRVYANAEYGRQVDVKYSPSGRWLATVAEDGRIIVYDAHTGIGVPATSVGNVKAKALTFSTRNSCELYIGDAVGCVHVSAFDEDTGQVSKPSAHLPETPSEPTREKPVKCLAVSSCGRWLAAGRDLPEQPSSDDSSRAWGSSVSLWDVAAGRVSWDVAVPDRSALGLAFSPDASSLAVAYGKPGPMRNTSGAALWSTSDGVVKAQSPLDSPARRAVAFSSDGEHLYSGGEFLLDCDLTNPDGSWRESECESVKKWGVRSLAAGRTAADAYVAYGCGDGLIRFYDTTAHKVLPLCGYHECHADHVDVCYSPDGHNVASVGRDGLSLWRFPPASEFVLAEAGAAVLDLSEDGSMILADRRVAEEYVSERVLGRHEVTLWRDRSLVKTWTVAEHRAGNQCGRPPSRAHRRTERRDGQRFPWVGGVYVLLMRPTGRKWPRSRVNHAAHASASPL